MGSVIAGFSCSHAPSIAHAYDHGKVDEEGWKPWFEGLEKGRQWLMGQRPDAMVVIYNDHVDQFFLDAWPTFSIGIGNQFPIADEGWGPRPFPPVPGVPGLARDIADGLVSRGIDVTVCHEQVVDHGILSPLPLIDKEWAVPIIPIAINVIFDPRPSPQRCWDFGVALREAIEESGSNHRVAVIGTGGLSHHLTGETFGQIDPEWDVEFMRLVEHEPAELKKYSLDDFANLGGEHSVEIVQWIAMRSAVGEDAKSTFKLYYPYQIMGYGAMGFAVEPE